MFLSFYYSYLLLIFYLYLTLIFCAFFLYLFNLFVILYLSCFYNLYLLSRSFFKTIFFYEQASSIKMMMIIIILEDCPVCRTEGKVPCNRESVTYEIKCIGCNNVYVGETSRSAYTSRQRSLSKMAVNFEAPS